jgi:hypothetical protein
MHRLVSVKKPMRGFASPPYVLTASGEAVAVR